MDFDGIVSTTKDALTVKRIFGEPNHVDGVTVIPAAAVTGGFGAGSGKEENGRDGEGGGFGMTGRPVGAYVVRNGEVTWVPAVDLARIATMAATVAVAYLLTRRPRSRR